MADTLGGTMVVAGTAAEPLVRAGAQALWGEGDRGAARDLFDVAWRAAEAAGEPVAMCWAALGLSGLWLGEHRNPAAAALAGARLRRALAEVPPHSSLGLRLRARLGGEADLRDGRHDRVLAAARAARTAGDPVAVAEAAGLAYQCLSGPDHAETRREQVADLIAASHRTGRRGDLLTGLLWRVVDHVRAGDALAGPGLAHLRQLAGGHRAVGFAATAVEGLLGVRAGRLADAEARADVCAARGLAAADPDAAGWRGTQLFAVRWFQGRAGELLPLLRELADDPSLSETDDSHLAELAVAAALAGDRREAASALARLRGADLARLPCSGTWLGTMHAVVEAADLLGDEATAGAAYRLLRPYAHLPMVAGPGVACFGSVQHALGVASLTAGDPARAVTHLRAAVRQNGAIGHRPATVLSRARLAWATRLRNEPGDAAEARGEHERAVREAAELGMILPAYETRAPGHRRRAAIECRRRSGRWVLQAGERTVLLDDSLGLGYLAELLANPGRELPAARLAAGPGLPVAPTASGSSQPVLDEVAIRAYRQRIAGLRTAVEAGSAAARAEVDWLSAELRAASGLGGRSRSFRDADELARVSVGKAIRRALARIAAADPVLGRELRDSVTTGVRCCYRPSVGSGPR